MVFIICLLSYIVEFVVKAARVADRLPVLVPSPQRRLRRPAVGADGALAFRRRLQLPKKQFNSDVGESFDT